MYLEGIESAERKARFFHGLAIVRAEQSRTIEAIALMEKAIEADPSDLEFCYEMGVLLERQGRPREAIAPYTKALGVKRLVAAASFNLGTIHQSLGETSEAVVHYRRALREAPRHVEAHFNLGLALAALGEQKQAATAYRRALKLNPSHAKAHNNLGTLLAGEGAYSEAIVHFEQAVAAHQANASAENNWGQALHHLGRFEEAILHCERAISLEPEFAEAYNSIGAALHSMRRYSEAKERLEQALGLRPDFPEAHNNLGNALKELGRVEAAAFHFEAALALKPDYAEAYVNRGNLKVEQGQVSAGISDFEKAITLAPKRADFYRALTNFKTMAGDDPAIGAMQALLQSKPPLSETDQMDLHFSLGKALEDCGDPEGSFKHLIRGNALKRRQVAYDEAGTLGILERMRQVFTRPVLSRFQGQGFPSAVPIFVLGMPRSGTTLIEQVLASHPGTWGAGERNELEQAICEELGPLGSITARTIEERPNALRRIGERYVEAIRALAPGAQYVIDKQPANFRFIGLIHLALPEARIIHSCRDPLDTCVSCFSKLFTTGIDYCYDLRELGRYYRGYEVLMRHWRSVIPLETLLDASYEGLVLHFEDEARRILEHCRMDWDDGCARFWETKRSVRTASAAQVRRPLYSSSVGRARSVIRLLGPLAEELNRNGSPTDTDPE